MLVREFKYLEMENINFKCSLKCVKEFDYIYS